jgi:hypothetical protein
MRVCNACYAAVDEHFASLEWSGQVTEELERQADPVIEGRVHIGQLYVKVVEAIGLPSTDSITSDPFVRVILTGKWSHGQEWSNELKSIKYTKKKSRTLNPRWHETFVFNVCAPGAEIVFEVYNHSQLSTQATKLGVAKIPLRALMDQRRHNKWLDLLLPEKLHRVGLNNDTRAGRIHLLLHYKFSRTAEFCSYFSQEEEFIHEWPDFQAAQLYSNFWVLLDDLWPYLEVIWQIGPTLNWEYPSHTFFCFVLCIWLCLSIQWVPVVIHLALIAFVLRNYFELSFQSFSPESATNTSTPSPPAPTATNDTMSLSSFETTGLFGTNGTGIGSRSISSSNNCSTNYGNGNGNSGGRGFNNTYGSFMTGIGGGGMNSNGTTSFMTGGSSTIGAKTPSPSPSPPPPTTTTTPSSSSATTAATSTTATATSTSSVDSSSTNTTRQYNLPVGFNHLMNKMTHVTIDTETKRSLQSVQNNMAWWSNLICKLELMFSWEDTFYTAKVLMYLILSCIFHLFIPNKYFLLVIIVYLFIRWTIPFLTCLHLIKAFQRGIKSILHQKQLAALNASLFNPPPPPPPQQQQQDLVMNTKRDILLVRNTSINTINRNIKNNNNNKNKKTTTRTSSTTTTTTTTNTTNSTNRTMNTSSTNSNNTSSTKKDTSRLRRTTSNAASSRSHQSVLKKEEMFGAAASAISEKIVVNTQK